MGQLQPIYTAENIRIAYQLNWSLTVFWKAPVSTDDWILALADATEPDGVRILQHRLHSENCSQFLVSTRPEVAPTAIARSVKGRLQYLVRDRRRRPFQRNYDLRSVGSTKRRKLEAYVARQLKHHYPSDKSLWADFADLQIIEPEVDLSRWRVTSHARFWSNLHLVLVHDWRRCERRLEVWLLVRSMIRKVARHKGHLLSRVGIVPDHLHLTLGTGPCESPREVALAYLNNLAFARDMQPIFMPSCYIGTFGEYDLGAIK